MDDVVPRRVRPDNGDTRSLADAGRIKGSGEASDRVRRLAHAPLLTGGRVHEGQTVWMATRRREESTRGRIVGGHEADAALAAIAA